MDCGLWIMDYGCGSESGSGLIIAAALRSCYQCSFKCSEAFCLFFRDSPVIVSGDTDPE